MSKILKVEINKYLLIKGGMQVKSYISLEEAIKILNYNVNSLSVEEIETIIGLNRVISEDVYSQINSPPFNKSAMDGYALIAEDTKLPDNKLKVLDKVYAGGNTKNEVVRGTAIKIMTGAPIPKGANAVVKQENVIVKEGYIYVIKSVSENENICLEGEDVLKGSLLLKGNKKINYADIGMLVCSGVKKIKVYKTPRIAFISTGDEVVDINQELNYGEIYNSNKYTIVSRLSELGYNVTSIKHIKDDFKEIGTYIEKISKEFDLIITTGGVSVGEKDLVKDAIDITSGEKIFWKINIKPGSAVLFSIVNSCIIVSLSGNPTAALTTFELLVKTTLEKLSGDKELKIVKEKAILMQDINKKSSKKRFLRGNFEIIDCNQFVSVTQIKSGNGILSSALNSNCIIEIEENNVGKSKGEVVNIIKL